MQTIGAGLNRRRASIIAAAVCVIAVAVVVSMTTAAASGKSSANWQDLGPKIKAFSALPHFKAPGPPIATSSLKGKKIFSIPLANNIPFNKAIQQGEAEAARVAGAKVTIWPSTGQPSEWVRGMQQAIAQHVDAIALLGPNPALLGPQLKQARAAGIPVTMSGFYGENASFPSTFKGGVRFPFETAGALEADYAIWQSQGKADVIVIVSNDIPQTPPVVKGIKAEFAKYCPDCKVKYVNVPVVDWATKTTPAVQAALTQDPDANYVIPIYDGLAIFANAGIQAAGKTGKVKIVTFNGTPAVLKLIQDGDIVTMDYGTSANWIGWLDMDAAFRAMLKKKPTTAVVPGRIFDEANVAQAGTPPVLGNGYGVGYKAGFKKLWGVR
jgi:ribose transport system substrate-binding protein